MPGVQEVLLGAGDPLLQAVTSRTDDGFGPVRGAAPGLRGNAAGSAERPTLRPDSPLARPLGTVGWRCVRPRSTAGAGIRLLVRPAAVLDDQTCQPEPGTRGQRCVGVGHEDLLGRGGCRQTAPHHSRRSSRININHIVSSHDQRPRSILLAQRAVRPRGRRSSGRLGERRRQEPRTPHTKPTRQYTLIDPTTQVRRNLPVGATHSHGQS